MSEIDTSPESQQREVSRRTFLKRTGALTAGAVAFPYIVPSSALGLGGQVAASERIVMGCIGVGSQGTGNMRQFLRVPDIQIITVCDVDQAHREAAQNIVNETYENNDCVGHNDFREMIVRHDLDAVSIAVPDHWHSIPAITAADVGLDIYAEKPLALTIYEGRQMVNAVERNGTVWQTGSWQRSQGHFRHACELVLNGRIGEVHTVKVGLPTGSSIEPQPEMPIPDGFDYDFWLGPAPEAPYTEKRCHWDFRWIFDYSGGQLTDWAAHHVDIANWGMGTEHTGPVEVDATGEFPEDGLWNTAINYMLNCTYPPGASPVAPNGFTMQVSNSFPMGARFEGTDGWVYVNRGNELETEPAQLKDSEIGENETRLYESENHARNFVDCIRARWQTVTPIQPAHYAISVAHLGNISMKLGRPVRWNPTTERFIDDPTADRMLMRAMRGPWRI